MIGRARDLNRFKPLTRSFPRTREPSIIAAMFHVYIMASQRNGTLYIGMTDNLNRRVYEHQTGAIRGFTQRYGVKMLVWHEPHDSRESAFLRERAMKKWNRLWKLQLIEAKNPAWRDLALELEP